MKTEIIKTTELNEGDIFSFRTILKPIWFRFIEFEQGVLVYEEIRNKFRHTANMYCFQSVKRKIKS
ncbi:MAG: hypothetical protein WC998_04780 [Candidatus Paceibacterota bacterium]|jgi:hypothetical protein